jgi:hypothetical protein
MLPTISSSCTRDHAAELIIDHTRQSGAGIFSDLEYLSFAFCIFLASALLHLARQHAWTTYPLGSIGLGLRKWCGYGVRVSHMGYP